MDIGSKNLKEEYEMYELLVVSLKEHKEIRETCEKYSEGDVRYMVYQPDLAGLNEEDTYVFLVCEEENHARFFADLVFDKMRERVFCIEGYEGSHYFERCIRAGKDTVTCVCDILKTIYVDGVINLDFADFIQMISKSDYQYIGFEGNKLSVMNKAKAFLQENPFDAYVASFFASDKVDLSMEMIVMFTEYAEGMIGAIVLEQDSDLRLMLLYR